LTQARLTRGAKSDVFPLLSVFI